MDLLSKSQFVKGWQCPKMLWLDYNHPELYDESILDKNLLQGGDEVGELAREVLGGKSRVLIDQDFDFVRMTAETRRHLATGKTICEATFVADGMVSMADIFLPYENGLNDIIEVKASTKVKPYHLVDAAYQTYVVERAGYPVLHTYIAHVNGDFVCGEHFDAGIPHVRDYVPDTGSKGKGKTPPVAPSSYFILEDVTERVAGILTDDATMRLIGELKRLRHVKEEPDICPGKRCNNPHPCGYQGYCTKVPEWMLSLAGMGRAKALTALEKGIRTPADLLSGGKPTDLQKAQIASENSRMVVHRARLRDFLEGLSFPIYMLDFETMQTAIPEYRGTKPYQQIPTQYSLHILQKDGSLDHLELLAPSVGDPRRIIAEGLIRDIPEGACSVAYNMAFEKGRIAELAEAFPDLAPRLMDIHDCMKDLMVPFQKGWLYLPAMGGSYSIKKVLPALFPDDPSLDYHALEDVHNGAEAMDAFRKLKDLPKEAEEHLRERLLRYCELDTFAMVKLFYAIRGYAADAVLADAV